MLGDKLEQTGWRQGVVVKTADTKRILNLSGHPHEDEIILIVASQSCDIANNNIKSDPYIELSVSRPIDNLQGNLTHNKNARTLHTSLRIQTETADIETKQHIELKAYEKLPVPKDHFKDITPDQNMLLSSESLEGYIAWLISRYARPALPTEFNRRLSTADPKDKLRDKAKKINPYLSGIYVDIFPNTDIEEGVSYHVNLLGLASPSFSGNINELKTSLELYADIMRQAGMDVDVAVKQENEISVASFKRFRRFYYDDLSFRKSADLPSEVTAYQK
ncbi:hypothetical protein N9J88_02420 [Porticoccaceae bacterium]|nr:hypothetical protein [Porticoccaceae bacterium]